MPLGLGWDPQARLVRSFDRCLPGRQDSGAMTSVVSVEEAQKIIFSAVSPGPTVRLPLRSAVNRTLAEAVVCDIDFPPFDRALMDGYAVRAADMASVPATLKVVGQVPAGEVPQAELAPGEAMQISTGAPIPAGCDAVVRVEDSELHGEKVTIRAAVSAGQYIARRAEYTRAGQTVLEAGARLSAGRIAIAAVAGASVVEVYEQPTVAILVTGDELVEVDRVPSGPRIRDSNRYLLDALVRECHCRPVDLGVARDDRSSLTARIKEGLSTGFLCMTGGVSMGEYDSVPECLQACGATIRFHKLALRPGKPALFATTEQGAYVFALPGNPVSAFATFRLLVLPALARRQGRPAAPPRTVRARLTGVLSGAPDGQSCHPARVEPDDRGQLLAEPLSWRASGDPFGLARANALAVLPPGSPARRAGDEVQVLLLEVP